MILLHFYSDAAYWILHLFVLAKFHYDLEIATADENL